MKFKLALFAASSALTAFLSPGASAETVVKLDDVHLCCISCVRGVDEAVAKVPGASAAADAYTKKVMIFAPDQATAQKAVDALVTAGYYAKSSDKSIVLADSSGAEDKTVKSVTVCDVHLCCEKCATMAKKALAAVPGVTGDTCEKDSKSFEVTGEFNEKAVFAALNEAGLSGHKE